MRRAVTRAHHAGGSAARRASWSRQRWNPTEWLAGGVCALRAGLAATLSHEALCTLGAELALLCWLVGRSAPRAINRVRLRRAITALGSWPRVRNEVLMGNAGAATGWLVHELALCDRKRSLGSVVGAIETRLDGLSDPLRRLELRYFLEQAGQGLHGAAWRSWARVGHSFRRLGTAAVDLPAWYELAHYAAYVTDFGRAADRLPTGLWQRLGTTVRAGLAGFWSRSCLDLTAELLLADDCLGARPEPETIAIARAVEAAVAHQALEARTAEAFASAYHPVLVVAYREAIRLPAGRCRAIASGVPAPQRHQRSGRPPRSTR